jgi:hypothetical protein
LRRQIAKLDKFRGYRLLGFFLKGEALWWLQDVVFVGGESHHLSLMIDWIRP